MDTVDRWWTASALFGMDTGWSECWKDRRRVWVYRPPEGVRIVVIDGGHFVLLEHPTLSTTGSCFSPRLISGEVRRAVRADD